MLTKAIIQSVDYTRNICRVRIPLFENASRNTNIIEADAQFSVVPGIYNSYKTGDVVFIGFEENKMELPVILGKLFVSASDEAGSYRGSLSGNSLAVTDTAQLPYSTVFNFDKIAQNNTLYKNLNTPKKLADSIINLQRVQSQRYQTIIKILVDETTYYLLYLKTADDFTYHLDNSDEPLYRLCTALKNSQAENSVIPLDLATKITIEKITEVAEDGTEEVIEKEIIDYTPLPALLQVQEYSSTSTLIKINVFIGENKYEVIKDDNIFRNDFLEVQSFTIYY